LGLLAVCGAVTKAATYNEGVSGDISNSQAAPTNLALTLDNNSIIGNVNGTASDSHDWISLTVPAGMKMTSYVNASYASNDVQGFTGFNVGASFAGSAFAAGSYAGYAHFGTGATNNGPAASTVGVDLLPLMANPAVAPGATGFTPPLGAGTYTFLIQQLGASTSYEFDAKVVPEPESVCLPAGGLLALAPMAWKRRR
jgi:hypothetical protein